MSKLSICSDRYDSLYIYRISKYNNEFASNQPDPLEVLEFISSWWTNHILKMDADYEKFKKEINAEAIY